MSQTIWKSSYETMKEIIDRLIPNKRWFVGGVIVLLVGIILILLEQLNQVGDWLYWAGGVLVLLGLFMIRAFNDLEVTDLAATSTRLLLKSLADAQERVEKTPEKAKPAWDVANVTLQAYFNRNLGQIRAIFTISVLVMLAGFVLIGISIYLALVRPDTITPAVVGGVAGVITEFVGATLLNFYRSTVEQALRYTVTLERMSSVGMAMQVLDTIGSPQDGPSKAKLMDAKIAVAKLLLASAKGDLEENKDEQKDK